MQGLQGVMELLKRTNVKISGKRAVVIGRSNIVGMPVALLLQAEDATVTVVHSRTPNAEVGGLWNARDFCLLYTPVARDLDTCQW